MSEKDQTTPRKLNITPALREMIQRQDEGIREWKRQCEEQERREAAQLPIYSQSDLDEEVSAASRQGAAQEREECARIAEETYANPGFHSYFQTAGSTIAWAIRARAARESEG